MMNLQQAADAHRRLLQIAQARNEIRKLEPIITSQVKLGFTHEGSDTTPTIKLLDERSRHLRAIESAAKPTARYALPGRRLF